MASRKCDISWDDVASEREKELLREEHEEKEKEEERGSARTMEAHEITNFIEVIKQAHGCRENDIVFHYEPIFSEDNVLSFDELALIFSIRSLVGGQLSERVVHSFRVIVPQEVQQRAKSMLRIVESDDEKESAPEAAQQRRQRARKSKK